ncbi:unnamed protein product, partial [Brassica rapa subsp. narinosa]
MDRRSWLWRRKSSEKSPGETESTGSLSSLSERFSDDQAEKEAAVLKQQLDASVSKVSSLEDQNSHLDSALKECVRQLWQVREEQSQKIQEAVNKKCSELESQIKELQARLETGKQEVATTASAH